MLLWTEIQLPYWHIKCMPKYTRSYTIIYIYTNKQESINWLPARAISVYSSVRWICVINQYNTYTFTRYNNHILAIRWKWYFLSQQMHPKQISEHIALVMSTFSTLVIHTYIRIYIYNSTPSYFILRWTVPYFKVYISELILSLRSVN